MSGCPAWLAPMCAPPIPIGFDWQTAEVVGAGLTPSFEGQPVSDVPSDIPITALGFDPSEAFVPGPALPIAPPPESPVLYDPYSQGYGPPLPPNEGPLPPGEPTVPPVAPALGLAPFLGGLFGLAFPSPTAPRSLDEPPISRYVDPNYLVPQYQPPDNPSQTELAPAVGAPIGMPEPDPEPVWMNPITITSPRAPPLEFPIYEPGPITFPFPDPVGLPRARPGTAPAPGARPAPAPQPIGAPSPVPSPQPLPRGLPLPSPAPVPSPVAQPPTAPARPAPIPVAPPFPAPRFSPEPLPIPSPQPSPMPSPVPTPLPEPVLTSGACPPCPGTKTKTKDEQQNRRKCKTGTYLETRDSVMYHPQRRDVRCR